jgi:hypothetical protein
METPIFFPRMWCEISTVLINGERVALNLQVAEGGSAN